MAFTHTFGFSFARSGESLPYNESVTGDTETAQDVAIPIALNQTVAISIAIATLKSVFMVCDQAINMNVNTGGGQAISLVANSPLIWRSTDSADCPLGVSDVTALVVDNASAAAATLKIRVLSEIDAEASV